jgi:hypothetical protein
MGQFPLTSRWRFLLPTLAAVTVAALLVGCGSGAPPRPGLPAPVLPATAAPGLPAFPAPDAPPAAAAPQVARGASGSLHSLQGSAFSAQSAGSASYVLGASGSYVFSPQLGGGEPGPPAQHQAWALYRFDGLDVERPYQLDADVAVAGAVPGGDPAALQYYLAVANYTRGAWDWFGPFTDDARLTLNAPPAGGKPLVNERYIDAAGTLYACLLVDSQATPAKPGNPQGRAAAGLATLTVSAAASTYPTKPLFLPPQAWKTGSSVRLPRTARQASALQPGQFPVVSWTDVAETPVQVLSRTEQVRVYRQGPDDAAPLLAGTVAASAEKFTDPLDCAEDVPSARGGTTYRYLLQAVNQQGTATPAATPWFTVPILAPQGLQATQDLPGGIGTQVSWLASDGAVRYRIGRSLSADGSGAVELGTADAPALSYLDTTAPPGQYYWYFVRAEGQGDANPANGLEAGALSPLSSPAQGLRGYALSLHCATAGVAGSGSTGDPYQLSSGQTYQFTVTDQSGNTLTNFCAYSVEPAATASFTAPPGTLGAVQAGGGAFAVAASFSYQSFTWTATAQCMAN